MMNSLIERLIATHRHLNREIRREAARGVPDHFRLRHLKKQRLAVKDRLVRHIPEASEFRRAACRLLARVRGPRQAEG
ncbi:YdcH family protein [Hephaestia mangrovi]|uniref:YdcH family protein n=1 Tax=Hephaestia mangrovi TaxID=2873268 RepID=UPI001CA76C2B|nr:YdcH family protein [Hephaestia mangrovi]MBY8828787.1 YdcH family protein [Hephaestia mangrovi]